MLVSLDGGQTYRRRGRRIIRETPPPAPAAIPIYNATGSTRLLVIDLDTSKTSRETVQRDLTGIQNVLARAGGRAIIDHSPSGGHHVYVPLAEPLTLGEARPIIRAIARRWPSVDITPMLNPITGVIRPPGSRYKHGRGYQELDTPLSLAYDILRRPAGRDFLTKLNTELRLELDALESEVSLDGSLSDDFGDAPWLPLRGGPRLLTSRYREIASTGIYDTSRYRSPSEARQAVLCSAVAAGLQLVDVAKRIDTGLWAGLSSFYQRYHMTHRRKSLLRDWKNAESYVRQQRAKPQGTSTVRQSDTRGSDTHRGYPKTSDHQFVRVWISAVDAYAPDNLTPDQHMLLRSLAEAAQKTGKREVEFGTRSLSVAAGKRTHPAVARSLVLLRNTPDPFIELVEQHQGTVADRYRLRLPDQYEHHSRLRWRAGKIHGVRPAFRELGAMAALTYEALEAATEPQSGRGVANQLHRSPAAVHEALSALAAWDLAEHDQAGWKLSPRADLNLVAEALGVLDEIREQVQRIRTERQQWWRWLGVRRLAHKAGTQPQGGRVDQPPAHEEPPPDDDAWNDHADWNIPTAPPEDEQLTLLRMLEQLLDARPMDEVGGNQRSRRSA